MQLQSIPDGITITSTVIDTIIIIIIGVGTGGGGPGPPDFFVWGAQYARGPLTFEKCRPIFELKVTPY